MATCPHCRKTASGDWLVKEHEDFIVKCNRCGKNFTLIMIGPVVIPLEAIGEQNDI